MSSWFFNVLHTVEGSLRDYHALAQYHYRTEPIRPVTNIYKIRARHPFRKDFPDPIAVIVYRMPIPDLRARAQATNGYFHQPSTLSARLKLVNKTIRYIARLIVDPRFRRLGLATKLLTESLATQTVPIVETLTPIDFTNIIFQRAGFTLHYIEAPTWYHRFVKFLEQIGLEDWDQLLPSTLQHRLALLDAEHSTLAEKEIKAFIKHFIRRQDMPAGIDRCKFLLSKIPFPQAYLIWRNANWQLPRSSPQ